MQLGTLEYLITAKDSTAAGINSSEKRMKQAGNAISAMTIAKGQMIADFAKQAVRTVLNVTKQLVTTAVKSYAEFEQLEGGVKKLFGPEAQKQVMKYAQIAYKTAGLSANEYMQTVTDFSAALINGLGGDTAQAADVADMAVRDMADNVNTFGSSMDSVQNAYKGFAKQNFTMLDNLKLGYGGTRKEMERLLKDAEAYEKSQGNTVKYSINNLADIYKAINSIQRKNGITGTTEAEAEKTISGSIASAKAAWENMMTSLGDGQNVRWTTRRFGATLKTVVKNVKPVAINALKGLLEGAKGLLPVVGDLAKDLFNELGRGIFGKDWDITIDWVMNAWDSVKNAFNVAVEWVGNAYNVTVKWIQTAWAKISGAFTAAADWVGNAYTVTVKWVQNAWAAVKSAFTTAADWVGNTYTTTVKWVQTAWASVKSAIDQVAQGVWDNVVNFTLGLFKGVQDFIDGLPHAIDIVVNFIKGVGDNITTAFGAIEDDEHDTSGIPEVDTSNEGWDAKGQWSVPYDGYRTRLHRGELVMNATQARQYREGSGGTSEVVAAIQSLRNDMQNLKLVVGRKTFGEAVVDYGGNRMSGYIGGSESRLAAGYGT